MLRHASGFKLANDGVDPRTLQHYLGHKTSDTQSSTPSCRLTSFATYGAADVGRSLTGDLGWIPLRTALSPDRFKGWEAE
jgi:hypothetical protein